MLIDSGRAGPSARLEDDVGAGVVVELVAGGGGVVPVLVVVPVVVVGAGVVLVVDVEVDVVGAGEVVGGLVLGAGDAGWAGEELGADGGADAGVGAGALLPAAGLRTVGSVVVWLRPAGATLARTGVSTVAVGLGAPLACAGLPVFAVAPALVFVRASVLAFAGPAASGTRGRTRTASVERRSGAEAIGVTVA